MKRRACAYGRFALLCVALTLTAACDAGADKGRANDSTTPSPARSPAGPSAAAPAEEPAPLPALAILDEYQREPAAADRKYKGRTVVISGAVAATGKSKAGVPFVSFQRPGAASPAGAMVVCSLAPDQEAAVRALEKGREVKLAGRVQGTLTGNVLLENCVLRR